MSACLNLGNVTATWDALEVVPETEPTWQLPCMICRSDLTERVTNLRINLRQRQDHLREQCRRRQSGGWLP